MVRHSPQILVSKEKAITWSVTIYTSRIIFKYVSCGWYGTWPARDEIDSKSFCCCLLSYRQKLVHGFKRPVTSTGPPQIDRKHAREMNCWPVRQDLTNRLLKMTELSSQKQNSNRISTHFSALEYLVRIRYSEEARKERVIFPSQTAVLITDKKR